MTDIGVVAALRVEAATIDASLDAGRIRVSGMGMPRAAAAAEALLEEGASALVSWGIAGGLAEDLQPGDLVLADRIDSNAQAQACDSRWVDALAQVIRDAGMGVHVGPLWCADEPVGTPAAKQRLATRGYMVVDMESAAVVRVARRAGVPFVAVKCVSDPARRALPASVMRLLHPDGTLRLAGLGGLLVRGPREWRALRDMRRDFLTACAGLRCAAPALVASCST